MVKRNQIAILREREGVDYEGVVQKLKEDLKDHPDVQALVMLIWETGLRFREAYSLTAEEFARGRYHSPKTGKQEQELPALSEETRGRISALITEDGRIFKKDEEYYKRMISEYSGGLRVWELTSYKRRQGYETGNIVL